MKNTDTQSPEAVALSAACILHPELLQDESFAGYDGTKAQFDNLYRQLFVIARDEVSLEVDPINMVIETFYVYQTEIVDGVRDPEWYLYL